MKRVFLILLAMATLLPATNKTDQFNLSYWLYKPVSVTGYVATNGTTLLTADWNVGAFDLTCVDMTATGTVTGNNLTASPTLGAEINTGFASWTATSGWTYGSGKWTHSTGTTALNDDQSAVFNITKTYKITITYTWAGAGSVFVVTAGGITFPSIYSSASTTVSYYLYPTATTRLAITPTTGFTGSIDSVSIKELTQGEISNGGFTLGGTQFLIPSGNAAHPAIASIYDSTTGLFIDSSGRFNWAVGGSRYGFFTSTGISMYSDTAKLSFGSSLDTFLWRDSAATLQMGVDAASPITQTIKGSDTSASDTAGGDIRLRGGTSKGSGSGGAVYIGTTTSGAAAATDNTYIDRVKIDDTGTTMLGANAQATNIKQATVVVTTTAAATATATNLIPAGATVIGVTTRVTSAVTGDAGFTGFDVGHSGTAIVSADQNAFGDNVTPSINETTDGTDSTVAGPINFCTAADVVLTQRGGSTFVAGGVVRVTVHYINLTAPST